LLTTYLTRTKQLLQNPAAPVSLYSDADLTEYINIARGQMAGEARCIRYQATLNTVIGQRPYPFSSLNTGVSSTNGIAGALHIRSILYAVGTGQQWIEARAWQWFAFFYLNDPIPSTGAPDSWSQYGQGASGSFYLDPIPDFVYNLTCDTVCYPIDLVDDTTVEAIPYLWTDAVPFFAAYYALLSAQSSARLADAERMYNYYQTFAQRARQAANPVVNPGMYEDSEDPTKLNKIGLVPAKGGNQ